MENLICCTSFCFVSYSGVWRISVYLYTYNGNQLGTFAFNCYFLTDFVYFKDVPATCFCFAFLFCCLYLQLSTTLPCLVLDKERSTTSTHVTCCFCCLCCFFVISWAWHYVYASRKSDQFCYSFINGISYIATGKCRECISMNRTRHSGQLIKRA